MIVTAGAIDCHVHFICPQLAYEAISSGETLFHVAIHSAVWYLQFVFILYEVLCDVIDNSSPDIGFYGSKSITLFLFISFEML